jgi:RNA polymerase sigma factor (sigma-70 family)
MSFFRTTRWSVVQAAGRPGSPDARTALEALCSAYWYPLYSYARRRGHDEESARDLTQGFFAELLEKNWVEAADRERGRFRAFLLTAMKRWIGRQHDRERAKKRGGDIQQLALDLADGERRFSLEPVHEETPERIFDRNWALTVLARALEITEREMISSDRGELFAALKPLLGGVGEVPSHREVAEELGMSEGAVKTAAHRLRARYGDCLRREIADTLVDEDEVEAEIEHLLHALR